MVTTHSRRALLALALILAASVLFVASPAHAATPNVITASQTNAVGSGQFVSTSATIDRGAQMMWATSRVWTTNWFWGFHGCVEFDFLSAWGTVLLHSQKVCQGVDGTAIGVSDRTTSVAWHLYPSVASQMTSVRIIHSKL
jgi:hypothetical protein